jgi:hypothetical protein
LEIPWASIRSVTVTFENASLPLHAREHLRIELDRGVVSMAPERQREFLEALLVRAFASAVNASSNPGPSGRPEAC